MDTVYRGSADSFAQKSEAVLKSKKGVLSKASPKEGVNNGGLPHSKESPFEYKLPKAVYIARHGKKYRAEMLAKKKFFSMLALAEDPEEPPMPTAKEVLKMVEVFTSAVKKIFG